MYGVPVMKLKLLLVGLWLVLMGGVYSATSPATKTETDKSAAATGPMVSASQAAKMESVVNGILKGAESVSGPGEIFRFINGQEQIKADERETTLSGAITSAKEANFSIVCYEEGKIVAATDPSLIGRTAEEFKAGDGRTVLSLVVDTLRKKKETGEGDRALVTYEERSGNVSNKVAIYALGRNSFTKFGKGDKKYVLLLVAPIA